MGKPARTKWKCPECGHTHLAGIRPRKDDARRYCLPCTERSGRLVQRFAPTLERERAERQRRSKARDAARRAEAKRKADAKWIRGRVDMRKVIKDALRLPIAKAIVKRRKADPPSYSIRTSSHGTSGWYHSHREHISINAPATALPSQFIGTILHELAHWLCHIDRREWGDADTDFWAMVTDLHEQWNAHHSEQVYLYRTGAYMGEGGIQHGRKQP